MSVRGVAMWMLRVPAILLFVAVFFLGAALAPGRALAWSDFGHMEVTAVAFAKLTPPAKARVAALLKLNPRYASWIVGAPPADETLVAFMRASTWADAIKNDRAYKDDQAGTAAAAPNIGYRDLLKHRTWHYVNRPFSPDGTATLPASTPNVATQLPILRAALADPATSDDAKSYALVWLLHLVGDIHQPLHCVSRFDAALPHGDRGGNAIKITGNAPPAICDDPRYCPYGPPDDLHIFWDTLEGDSWAVAPVRAAAAALPKADARQAAVLDVETWVQEGFELAKTAVYVPPIGAGPGPFSVDAAYQSAARKVARARIALAGARLANLLNASLGR